MLTKAQIQEAMADMEYDDLKADGYSSLLEKRICEEQENKTPRDRM